MAADASPPPARAVLCCRATSGGCFDEAHDGDGRCFDAAAMMEMQQAVGAVILPRSVVAVSRVAGVTE